MLKTEKQEQRQWEKEPERGEQQTEAAPKHQQIHAYSGCRSSLRLHLCALCTTADPASVSVAMASKGAPSAADREQVLPFAPIAALLLLRLGIAFLCFTRGWERGGGVMCRGV
ncbi:hypothetical protein M758_2G221300 [Ceratodon purpureus]|nr:hypothetical protein M758_2G221300 [Ceratodon purpureus]